MRALALALGLASAACSTSSPSGTSGPGDASGGRVDVDAGDAGDAEGTACVPHDGSYACLGGSVPACPPVVYAVADPYAGCDFSVPTCFECDGIVGGMNVPPMIGTGATCACRDAGYPIPDGSTGYWDCSGTGSTCQ